MGSSAFNVRINWISGVVLVYNVIRIYQISLLGFIRDPLFSWNIYFEIFILYVLFSFSNFIWLKIGLVWSLFLAPGFFARVTP